MSRTMLSIITTPLSPLSPGGGEGAVDDTWNGDLAREGVRAHCALVQNFRRLTVVERQGERERKCRSLHRAGQIGLAVPAVDVASECLLLLLEHEQRLALTVFRRDDDIPLT